jgi:hypothetical protein
VCTDKSNNEAIMIYLLLKDVCTGLQGSKEAISIILEKRNKSTLMNQNTNHNVKQNRVCTLIVEQQPVQDSLRSNCEHSSQMIN